MALITDQDRREEFENLKEYFEEVDIISQIIDKKEPYNQACMLIALPTSDDTIWESEEMPEDPHLATAYLMQLGEEENQLTKYMMLYFQVAVDLTDVSEIEILRLINKANRTLSVGHFFYSEDVQGVLSVQYKVLVGSASDQYTDIAVVCEHIWAMGDFYDQMKADLLTLKNS